MEGKGRICYTFLIACLFIGCRYGLPEPSADVLVSIGSREYGTRALNPDESLLKDISLLIFDEQGNLEYHRYLDNVSTGVTELKVPLLTNKKYSFYACANFGYQVKAETVAEIKNLKWHMAYPDEYREGMAMAGMVEDITIEGSEPVIHIPLKRLMAKISLKIDRGGLDEGVRMDIISVKIGNCPKSANVFKEGKVEGHDECFTVGFHRDETECSVLNKNAGGGISSSLSLFMLENMQGRIGNGTISSDSDKILDKNDIRTGTASFLEIEIDYSSSRWFTTSDPLVYRLYLGENRNSLDVERNCHYNITVIPENDGLAGDGWRVDKSGMESRDGTPFFEMVPSGYMQGNIGDTVSVRCNFHPSDADFDIGLEELEYDKERGIYDYIVDEDGRGVTLILRSQGRGILYMSAGTPINETGMLVIEVNKPKNI